MEELLFTDGVYPDFSLLKEVLYPLYFESEPCNAEKEWNEWIREAQYREEPQCAAAELRQSGISDCGSNDLAAGEARNSTAAGTRLQCRRRSSRGGKKRSSNRLAVAKVDKWCLTQDNTKKLQLPGHRMTCMMQIPDPSIIYLLEESVRKLPKRENASDDNHVTNFPLYGECSKATCQWNCHRANNSSSTLTSNAMELLNLINMKCTHLNKLDGKKNNIGETESKKIHDFSMLPKIVKDVSFMDDVHLASANSEQDRKHLLDSQWVNPPKNGCPSSKEYISDTPHEISTQSRDKAQTGQPSTFGSIEHDACVRRTPRKQRTPTKSVERLDPSFHGIEFQMHLCFEEKCDDCQLMVTSFYSRGRSRRKSTKSNLRFKSTSISSGSEDDQMLTSLSRNKQCASCKTQKTPLWRDAEDGTPLCNACGIRYKKYGLRCGQCWNIPKKDGKSCTRYCGCGGTFRAPM
ncbi:GATA-type zinc finger protein 1 isoform X2 [Pseudophryne corroboree]|uniref:GATA-type zinc finger protein 1 isoform X2 n=1 Tax=Pseudophryne corroboree TaxID=495146 RepID=UPI003081C196